MQNVSNVKGSMHGPTRPTTETRGASMKGKSKHKGYDGATRGKGKKGKKKKSGY